ncbi:hypothetical protein Cni_G12107 [Canna indica]|uniref:Biogenesis of lysosome-related organelles complex 1 subunit 7 n=1 Tax=Canna indica TaxID=4628 RepID=A0AAQ3K7G5_9LILI|nr:hypothetical protein Cni_G12107 [Canna indica]
MDGGDISATANPPFDRLASGEGGADGSDAHHAEFDALAKAISSTLGAVMREFDSRAEGAARSQDELYRSLDRLTGELDKLLEDAPLPFIMQYATKISTIRKRVSALNLTLRSIQRRIDNMDGMLSAGTSTNTHQLMEQPHGPCHN